MTSENYPQERKFSAFSKVILWCACTDKEILKTCNNATVMKYMALGFLMLVPAIFAIPSMTFFAKTAFFPTEAKAIYPALACAVLWSMMVLTFDRFFIINKGGFLKAVGRLLIAALFSYIIAEPLVIQMFNYNLQKSIAEKSSLEKENLVKRYEGKIAATETEIAQLHQKMTAHENVNGLVESSPEIKELRDRIMAKQAEIKQAQIDYGKEVSGTSDSMTGKQGIGPMALSLQATIDHLNTDLADLNSELETAKAAQQSVVSLKKQMVLKDESNLQNLRERNLQLIDQKTARITQLKQEQIQAVAEFEHFAVTDFLTLHEELDELAQKHATVRLQKWLFTALLFLIDIFAVALKLFSDSDDELSHKQATVDFASRVKEEVKQQAYSETVAERVALQVRNMLFGLDREGVMQLWQHRLDKKAMLTEMLRKHSHEDNRFHDWFVKSPQYSEAVMREYLNVAEMTFAQIVAELCKEERENMA